MATPPGSREKIPALDAYVKLMRAAESVTTRVHTQLPKARLTLSQFGVLEALLHLGPLNQSVLADKLLKSPGNLTLVVDNLEKSGLVRRVRRAEDRRCVRVDLTERGKRLIAGLFPQIAARIAADFATLTTSEQTQLARLCKKLGLGLATNGGSTR